MDTSFLHSLILVVEKGSIAESARALGLTPAAVGQRIRTLENELKVRLFDRVGPRVHPTQACLHMLPRMRRLVHEAAELAGDADETGLTGTLRVGAISTVLTDLMPNALRELKRAHPTVQPYIVPGASKNLYADLEDEKIDAAFLVEPPFQIPKTLRSTPICKEPMVFLSRNRPAVAIEKELEAGPYLAYDPSAWGGKIADSFLQKRRLAVEPIGFLDSLDTIAILVSDGFGVSLLPRWAGLNRYADRLFISEPLGRGFSRNICLLTHATPRRPAMIDALISALKPMEANRA